MLNFSFTGLFSSSNPKSESSAHLASSSNSYGKNFAEMEKKYKTLDIIGSGGFGKVHAGYRRADKHPVAIKVVSGKKILAWRTVKGTQVPLEVAMHSKVHHIPGVVGLLDHYQTENGNHYLILERPEPVQDLFDFITQRGALDEFIARVFFRQIVEIVQSLHQQGVCHRDIKDENILVDMHSGRCYLIDFGSSEELRPDAYQGYDAGTKVYCPPEWVKSGSFHPSQATVWSLGILLYDMLCGDIPFENEDQILRHQITWRSMGAKISDRAKDLIRRCLAYKPDQRPTLQDILDHPWLAQVKFDENFAYYFQSYCTRRARQRVQNGSVPITVPTPVKSVSPSITSYSQSSPTMWTFDSAAVRNDSLDSQGNSTNLSVSTDSAAY